MGVQVQRKVKLASQSGDELRSGCRAEQTRHVFNGQDVCTGLDDLLCETQVVVEGVDLFLRVEKV